MCVCDYSLEPFLGHISNWVENFFCRKPPKTQQEPEEFFLCIKVFQENIEKHY